jgi:manganese transport protein
MTAPPPRTEVTVEDVLPGEAAVAIAARRSLDGETRGPKRFWPFLGPAFVAAVAYIDPGNFATNIAGGAKFGYLLLWVILAANLIAMVVQTQSAKLGIATGKNLAELCRERFSRRTSIGLWIQAEIVAMATDIAEVVGAALGLNLLFGIPLFPAGLIAGAGAFAGSRLWSASSSPPSSSSSSTPAPTAAKSPSTSSSPASKGRKASCSPQGSSARP